MRPEKHLEEIMARVDDAVLASRKAKIKRAAPKTAKAAPKPKTARKSAPKTAKNVPKTVKAAPKTVKRNTHDSVSRTLTAFNEKHNTTFAIETFDGEYQLLSNGEPLECGTLKELVAEFNRVKYFPKHKLNSVVKNGAKKESKPAKKATSLSKLKSDIKKMIADVDAKIARLANKRGAVVKAKTPAKKESVLTGKKPAAKKKPATKKKSTVKSKQGRLSALK